MRIPALLTVALISGCADGSSDYTECKAAETNGEAYGTPDNLGPCVGRIWQRTASANQLILGFDDVVDGTAVMVHWHNGKMISVSSSSF